MEEKEAIKEEKRKPNKLIIIILIIGVIMYLSPLALLFIGAIFDGGNVKYEEKENIVLIEKDKAILRDVNSLYNDKDNTYVILGYIDNKKFNNKELNITYELYDKDNYVIGEATAYISLKKDKNYKMKATYYDVDANEVVSYKLKQMSAY